MGNRNVRKAESGNGDALARLVSELGRAAQNGWGPTARWLALFVPLIAALLVIAIILKMLGY